MASTAYGRIAALVLYDARLLALEERSNALLRKPFITGRAFINSFIDSDLTAARFCRELLISVQA